MADHRDSGSRPARRDRPGLAEAGHDEPVERARPEAALSDADEYAVISGRLREARDFLGLSQLEVARAVSMNRPAISAIENGHRKVSGLELRRFARLYRRPAGWLLGEKTEPDPEILAAVRDLAETDRAQVLRFAEFLAGAGQAPRGRPRTAGTRSSDPEAARVRDA